MALFRQAAYAIAVSLAATMSAAAADWPLEPATYPLFSPRPIAQWESEIGGRYWYSSGRTQLDLFGATQANGLISRLTYSDLQAHSGEVFGRAEHLSGFFIKGFVGGGAITGGGLRDEDFVTPSFPLYSSTNSEQRDGRLAYATVDLGWYGGLECPSIIGGGMPGFRRDQASWRSLFDIAWLASGVVKKGSITSKPLNRIPHGKPPLAPRSRGPTASQNHLAGSRLAAGYRPEAFALAPQRARCIGWA